MGTQSRKRHAALTLLVAARHIRAAQAAVDLDLDALGAGLHRRLDRLFDDATEGHALLQTFGDALGDQSRLELGALDLADGQVHNAAHLVLQLFLELLDADAFTADENAGTRGVNDDVDRLARALDLDARNAGTIEFAQHEFADRLVLQQQRTKVFLGGEPA